MASTDDDLTPSEVLIKRIEKFCRKMTIPTTSASMRTALADTVEYLFVSVLDFEFRLPVRTILMLFRNIEKMSREMKERGDPCLEQLLQRLWEYGVGRKKRRREACMIQADRLLFFLRLLAQGPSSPYTSSADSPGKYFPHPLVDALLARFGITVGDEGIDSILDSGAARNWEKALPRRRNANVSAARILKWCEADGEDAPERWYSNGSPEIIFLFYAIRAGAVTEVDVTE